MNRMRLLTITALLLSVSATVVSAEAPMTVSPGDVSRLALIEGRCPTFSWSSLAGATAYELVVFQLAQEGQEPTPVLEQMLPALVGGWTPSLDRCFERGGRYAWSVRAKRGDELSDWSRPALFQIAAGPTEDEFEVALEVVKSYLEIEGEGAEPASTAHEASSASDQELADTGDASGTRAAPATTQLSVDGNIDATSFTGEGSGLTSLDWDNLIDVPAGFADGTDNDTTYAGGTGLDLIGTTFHVDSNVARKNSSAGNQSFDLGTLYLDYSQNRVGIGVTSPAQPLDVAGTVAASTYAYRSPVTRYHSIPGSSFVPWLEQGSVSGYGWMNMPELGYAYLSYQGWSPGDAAGFGQGYAAAPVNLPHGATVEDLTCYRMDAESAHYISGYANLQRRPLWASYHLSIEDLASVDLTTTVPHATGEVLPASDTSITSGTIDNSGYHYWVAINFSQSGGSSMRFYGCRIEYTVSEVSTP